MTSPIFTVVIEDDQGTDEKGKPIIKSVTFNIHKHLLESASPELYKHLNNEMREGIENRLVLKEVRVSTFARFVAWLYSPSNHYGRICLSDISPLKAVLLVNRLFLFGDRFNINLLQADCLNRIQQLLLQTVPGKPFVVLSTDEDKDMFATIVKELLESYPELKVEWPLDDTTEETGNYVSRFYKTYVDFVAKHYGSLVKSDRFENVLLDNPYFLSSATDDIYDKKATLEKEKEELEKSLSWGCNMCRKPAGSLQESLAYMEGKPKNSYKGYCESCQRETMFYLGVALIN